MKKIKINKAITLIMLFAIVVSTLGVSALGNYAEDESAYTPMIIDLAVDGPVTDEILEYGVPIAVYANGLHLATVKADIPDGEYHAIAPFVAEDESAYIPMMIIDIAVDGPITDEMLEYGVPIAVYANGLHLATINADIPDSEYHATTSFVDVILNHRFPPNGTHMTHSANSLAPVPITYSWNITSVTPALCWQGRIEGWVWYSGWGLLFRRSGLSGSHTFTPGAHATGRWTFEIWNGSSSEVVIRGTASLR